MKMHKPVAISIPRTIKQFKVMSKCSAYIWLAFVASTAAMVALMFHSHFHFGWWNLAVLLATFGQSIFVLFLVHRIYTKSYLSLDAITKYFAAGFLLAVPTAFVFEMILVNGLSIVVILIMLTIKLLGGGGLLTYLYEHSTFFQIIFEFFNAFVVAATTEELCKYYVFRMIEHPDVIFLQKKTPDAVSGQLRMIVEGSSEYSEKDTDQCLELKDISHRQKAAALTIGMLSVALGLACAENVLYVFYLGGQNGGNASDEFFTLAMRSLFPIHAICAAMQSINVVKKYIEFDPSHSPADVELWKRRKNIGVGKIIFPAVVLHGFFDAVLMIIGVILSGDEDESYYNEGSSASARSIVLNVFTWLCVITLTGLGLVWYIKQKHTQKIRLQALDEREGLDEAVSTSFEDKIKAFKNLEIV